MRNVWQAEANVGVSDLSVLADDLIQKLRNHAWHRAFWYGGK
jgi:hypothetical protein